MNKSCPVVLAFLCLFLCATLPVYGHQDRIIKLEDGKLIGLPDEYQPARFSLEKKLLRIGKHEMAFTPFLKSLFPDDGQHELSILSSWYHGEFGGLPPYITFTIQPKNKAYRFQILFNLKTLDVINVQIVLTEGNTTRYLPIDLSGNWRKEIDGAIRKVSDKQ